MKKKFVVVDIDGTVAKLIERDVVLETPEDWHRLFNKVDTCEPRIDVIGTVEDYMWEMHTIIFCTARPDFVRDKTFWWLMKYVGGPTMVHLSKNDILMRSNGDYREDGIVKLELLSNAGITPENTHLCIDDSLSVIEAFTNVGFKVQQVIPEYSVNK